MKKKMKKIIVAICMVVVISLSLSIANKSRSANNEWNKEYEGMGIDHFFDIKPTNDGYIIAGTTWKPYEGQLDTGNGWLVKVDKDGNIIWQKHYGGRDEDGLWCVLETEDGYLAGGYTFSYARGIGNEDFWLIKVDKNGNEIWNKTYGTYLGELGKVIKAKDGGYLIVGYISSFKGVKSINGSGILIKTDINGEIKWYKTFDGNGFDYFYDVIETHDGYLISGITESFATHGIWDAWLIKVDKQGNEIWNKTYGWRGYGWKGYVWNAYVKEEEDGYVIAGYVLLGRGEVPYAYLIKVNKEGNEIWKKVYGGGEYDYVKDFEVIDDGYILAGFTESYNVGNFDAWLLKVDKEGNEIWNKSFGRRWEDKFEGIVVLEDGYLLCGKTEHEWGYGNGWLVKCNDDMPPKIKIVKPKENYLYIFDREIMAYSKTLIIGGITVIAEADKPEKIDRVEFYYGSHYVFDEEPRAIDYSPPYEWKCRVFGLNSWGRITVAARYGNAGAVAVDKMEVYIINLLPAPASAAAMQK